MTNVAKTDLSVCSEIPITNATSSREWHPLDDLIKKGHKQMLVGFRLVNSSCLDQASNKRKLAYSTAEFPLCLCMFEESTQSLILSVQRRQSPSPTWRVRLCFEYKASTKKYSQAKKSPLFFSHSFAVDWKRDRSWIGSVYSYTVTVPAEDQHLIILLFILR